MIQFGEAIGIGAEDNVIAGGTGNVAAIGCRGKGRISSIEEEREVRLIGIWNLRVVDGDCALVAVSTRYALRRLHRDALRDLGGGGVVGVARLVGGHHNRARAGDGQRAVRDRSRTGEDPKSYRQTRAGRCRQRNRRNPIGHRRCGRGEIDGLRRLVHRQSNGCRGGVVQSRVRRGEGDRERLRSSG